MTFVFVFSEENREKKEQCVQSLQIHIKGKKNWPSRERSHFLSISAKNQTEHTRAHTFRCIYVISMDKNTRRQPDSHFNATHIKTLSTLFPPHNNMHNGQKLWCTYIFISVLRYTSTFLLFSYFTARKLTRETNLCASMCALFNVYPAVIFIEVTRN